MTLSLPWSGLESSTALSGNALRTFLDDPEVNGSLSVCTRMPRKARPVAGITARDCPGDTPRHSARHSRSLHRKVWQWPLLVYPLMSANVPTERHRCPEMARDHYGEGYGGDGNDSRHPCRSPWRAPALRSGVQIGSPADLSNPLWALILSHTPNKEGHYKWPSLFGAGDGNRTHASSLGSCSSTIELHPRFTFSAHLRDPFVAYRQAAFHGALPGPHIPVRSLAAREAMLRVKRAASPTLAAWEAAVLPLNYTRETLRWSRLRPDMR